MLRRTYFAVFVAFAATLVLGSAVVAKAETITGTYASAIITQTGTYTVALQGTSTVVDVYDIAVKANDLAKVVAAVDLRVGPIAGDPYAPTVGTVPFQAWRWFDEGDGPYSSEYGAYLSTANFTRQSDSHFYPAAQSWLGVGVVENNDASVSMPAAAGYQLGRGSLSGALGIPGASQTNLVDVATIGVVHGTNVYAYLGINVSGTMTSDEFHTMRINSVPEPSTLALLATGIVGLIAYAWRKRR